MQSDDARRILSNVCPVALLVDIGAASSTGSFPFARAVSFPVIDAIHHHGQIAYIQSLLGDAETHFYEMANQ